MFNKSLRAYMHKSRQNFTSDKCLMRRQSRNQLTNN